MLKLFKNIAPNTYELNLFGDIGFEVSGSAVAREIQMLNDVGAELIVEHINSGGGSILDGLSIVSANLNSKATVRTINEGIAASMAGIIFVSGNERHMRDYAKLMIHDPSFNGESLEYMAEGKDKTALLALKDTLATILKNNCHMNKPEIEKLMTAETWFSSSDAKEKGLCDKIVVTKVKPAKDVLDLNLNNETGRRAYMQACNSILTNNTEQMNLKLVTDHLGVREDAGEAVILNAIKSTETSLDAAKNEVSALKAKEAELTEHLKASNEKMVEMKNSIDSYRKNEAEMLVDGAIKEGKFDQSSRETLTATALNDLEGFKTMLKLIKAPVAKLTEVLNQNTPSVANDRKDWDFDKWSKEDPEGLKAMQQNQPEVFNALLNAYC